MPLTVTELAAAVGGTPRGHGGRTVTGVSTPQAASPSDLIFIAGPQYQAELAASAAGAVLLPPGMPAPEGMAAIEVPNPPLAMARAVDVLVPPHRARPGISPRAILEDDVDLGAGVAVGAGAVLGAGARIGARTAVHPGATIGAGAVIGEDCTIHSGVHVYAGVRIGDRVVLHAGCVIGADGFGYVPEPLEGHGADEPFRHRKVRQIGTVVIEDDVEIGANTTIDRAALTETRIGRGTKIDNLVTVGHNVVIGRHCVIVGQAGISGSARLGDYVTVAGQAGLLGHIRVGDRATIGSQAGVIQDVEPGARLLGAPAIDARATMRAVAIIPQLPELRRIVREHERRLDRLDAAARSRREDEA